MLIPSQPELPESPRVRELSQRLRQTIQEFQRQYPMTPAEIHEAVRHAAGGSGSGVPSRWPLRILFWLIVIMMPVVMAAIIRAGR